MPPSCAGFLYTHVNSINNDDLLYGAVLKGLIQSHPIFLLSTGLHCIPFVTGSRLMLFLGTPERTFPNPGLIYGAKGSPIKHFNYSDVSGHAYPLYLCVCQTQCQSFTK